MREQKAEARRRDNTRAYSNAPRSQSFARGASDVGRSTLRPCKEQGCRRIHPCHSALAFGWAFHPCSSAFMRGFCPLPKPFPESRPHRHPRFSLLFSRTIKLTKQTQFASCLQRGVAKTKPNKPNFWLSKTRSQKGEGRRRVQIRSRRREPAVRICGTRNVPI